MKFLDFNFENMLYPKVVKAFWGLTLVFGVLGILISIGFGIISLLAGSFEGLLYIVFGPIVSIFWVFVSRISYELAMVFFKINENTQVIREDIERKMWNGS